MRHLKHTAKLGRTWQHRNMMLSNMVRSMIITPRVKTTLAKAKAARRLADRMITLGKKNTMASRRSAFSVLQDKNVVHKLFVELAPQFEEREGGYTRIIKLPPRIGDASEMALLEWVTEPVTTKEKTEKKRRRRGSRGKKKKTPDAGTEAVAEDKTAQDGEEPAAEAQEKAGAGAGGAVDKQEDQPEEKAADIKKKGEPEEPPGKTDAPEKEEKEKKE